MFQAEGIAYEKALRQGKARHTEKLKEGQCG